MQPKVRTEKMQRHKKTTKEIQYQPKLCKGNPYETKKKTTTFLYVEFPYLPRMTVAIQKRIL